jgi:hypothetical protein
MSLSVHSVVVGSYANMLRNMLVWLEKAQAFATAKPFDSANYLNMRLAPDMLPFSTQVMIASEIAKLGVARLAAVEVPKWEHQDTTLQDLVNRVKQTIEYLESFTQSQLDAAAVQTVVVPQRGKEALTFSAEEFVQRWSEPNFFFHVTTTYALLRHAGVDLGKANYLGIY